MRPGVQKTGVQKTGVQELQEFRSFADSELLQLLSPVFLALAAWFLTNGAPGCGAASDRSMIEQGTVARTSTSFLPAMMDQPILRRVVQVNTDCFQCRAANRPAGPPEIPLLRVVQISSPGGGMQLHLPQNLIGHPVADPGKNGLIEQRSFNR